MAGKAPRKLIPTPTRAGPLTVVPNRQRQRMALPPHLARLLVSDYRHPAAERPSATAPAPFPGLVQTYAVLQYFHDRFGPLVDAHVARHPETCRPKAQIMLTLPVAAAEQAIGEHTIPVEEDRDVRCLSASLAFYASLNDLVDPAKRRDDDGTSKADATFTVSANLVGAEASMPQKRPWYDPYTSGPRPAGAKQLELIAKEFQSFGGFTVRVPRRHITGTTRTDAYSRPSGRPIYSLASLLNGGRGS
jgi:hypothetical protein